MNFAASRFPMAHFHPFGLLLSAFDLRTSDSRLRRPALFAGRKAVSLSSFGGEGQGEEAVALDIPARWAGDGPRWKRSRGGNREKQPGPPHGETES